MKRTTIDSYVQELIKYDLFNERLSTIRNASFFSYETAK